MVSWLIWNRHLLTMDERMMLTFAWTTQKKIFKQQRGLMISVMPIMSLLGVHGSGLIAHRCCLVYIRVIRLASEVPILLFQKSHQIQVPKQALI